MNIENQLIKAFSSDITVNEGERAVTARISTNAVDRDGEVVIPQGIDSKQYLDNPVLFYNHAWAEWGAEPEDKLPVGKCVAIKREADALVAKFMFAERPESHPEGEAWMPDTLLSLYQQGVMNAFSIGFIPAETRPATDRDVEKFGAGCRRVVSKSKLFEVSCVPIPCNQEAVALAVSKGLLSVDAAKKMFDVDDVDLSTSDEKTTPTPAEEVVEEVKSSATKRTYFMPSRVATKPKSKSNTKAAEEVAKRRGRIYYV